MSTGVDRRTGKRISDWDHVVQCIVVIFTTRFGDRVMREWVGSDVPPLLGELANAQTFVRFYGAVSRAMTIKELNGFAREPRFRITQFIVNDVTRLGSANVAIRGLYMPRALEGDLTPEGPRVVTITPDGIRGVA